MSFQAYLDNIKAKTGKTPDDFRKLARDKGLASHGEIVAWLKAEIWLGHGHANAIAQLLINPGAHKAAPEAKLDALFSGKKVAWRKAYDQIATKLARFGPDLELAPNRTYINVLRGGKKIAILQPAAAERFDIGIKLKGVKPTARLEPAGSWNAMVTHRVRITDPKQLDAEVLAWLRQAYQAA